jgi:hypothetical protein
VLRTYFVGVVVAESAAAVQSKLDQSDDGVPRVEAERTPGTHSNPSTP